ncbi:MAG: hypothetical protein AAGF47_03795 [Planctomycetota bacterium]
MADLTTTIGLNSKQFLAGLKRVEDAVRQSALRQASAVRRVGSTINETVKTLVTVEAIKQIGRAAIAMAREAAEHNSVLKREFDASDRAAMRLRRTVGRGLALAFGLVRGEAGALFDTIAAGWTSVTNAVADLMAGEAGHGAAVDAAMAEIERMDRMAKAMDQTFGRVAEARARGLAASGQGLDADLERFAQEIRQIRKRTEAEKKAFAQEHGVERLDPRTAAQFDEAAAAEIASVEADRDRIVREARRRQRDAREMDTARRAAIGGDKEAVANATMRRNMTAAIDRAEQENTSLGIAGQEAQDRISLAIDDVVVAYERQIEAIRRTRAEQAAAARERAEQQRLIASRQQQAARDQLDGLRVVTLRAEGRNKEADALDLVIRKRRELARIDQNDALTDRQKLEFRRQTIDLLQREADARRAGADGAGAVRSLVGSAGLRSRVFGRDDQDGRPGAFELRQRRRLAFRDRRRARAGLVTADAVGPAGSGGGESAGPPVTPVVPAETAGASAAGGGATVTVRDFGELLERAGDMNDRLERIERDLKSNLMTG